MSMLSPATSTHPNISRPACGRCSIASRAISGRCLLRGDAGFGNEPIMREAEQRGLAYFFKLRLTANVKRMIAKLSTQREWINAGQGLQAKESLSGWRGGAGSAA